MDVVGVAGEVGERALLPRRTVKWIKRAAGVISLTDIPLVAT
jgi:hypothetical protein